MPLQWVRVNCFVIEVQRHQRLTPFCPLPEVGIERDARELPLEVQFVLRAVGGMVQNGIDVMENRLFRDRLIGVMGAELVKTPISDIVHTIPQLVILIQWKTLRWITEKIQVWSVL